MLSKPIKLQDYLYLYSGDIIKINDSGSLLIEILTDQTIKLRSIKKNKYLSRKRMTFDKSALDFSTNFEKALVFTVKKNDDGEISLQTNNEYLRSNKKNFHLSSEEKWLVITKPKNSERNVDIVDYEEIISISPHKEKEVSIEKLPITCKFYNNKSNDILKRTFEFTEERQEERNFAWSTDLTWGFSTGLKLDCSAIVGELGFSGNIEEKFSTSDSIKETKTTTIVEKFDIDCSPQKRVRVKLEATRIKTPYTARVKRLIDGRLYEYLVDGEYSRDDYSRNDYSHEEITTRNILIVGWTGSGKSTLANVLLGKKNEKGNFKEVFTESNQSTSETHFFQKSEEFEWEENYYCVIDNIGFGDNTEVEEKEILIRIGQAIKSVPQGLSHVLLVFDGRFSEKVKEDFDKLAALKITKSLITIIRSRFENFSNRKKCEEDRELLKRESPQIREVLNNCRGLLYVNNGDDRSRDKSRKSVLEYLHGNCPEVFKPKEWDNINNLIEKYIKDKEKLETEKATKQQIDSLETNTAAQVKKEAQGEEIREFIEVVKLK